MSTKKPDTSRRARFAAALGGCRDWLRGRFDGEHFTENLALLAVAIMLLTSIDTRNQADTATTAADNAIAAASENTAGTCQRARAATATNTLPYAVFDPDARQIRPEDEQVYVDRLLQLRDTLNLGLTRDCEHFGQPPNIDLLLNAKLREITERLTPTASRKRQALKPVPVSSADPIVQRGARAAAHAQRPEGVQPSETGGGVEGGAAPGEDPQTPGDSPSPPVAPPPAQGLGTAAVGALDTLTAPVCGMLPPDLHLC